ncbi:DUF2071 domain-containing protein [bacterium]|nr:DUF2071 domain-containing protein [Akkermansiaceae bacterium]MDB4272348.1 DUF2071 domain-containing protein [bacterium]MDA7519486.1 DUF2071 domain-containing protein [Akkermansiaceae bacterium]MDA7863405.1 DUF2071 domain-containing protein [Akkermansiaceae bacterium]MDA7931502.1 DUF2071 domain-containing protein [Akkermansiaceae bacterium]
MPAPTLEERISYQEKPKGGPAMYQSWNDLLFLHWEIEIDVLKARIPKRLNVDLHEGKAYVGIVPFFMNKVRPKFLPCLPGLSNFLELNVRTYVYDQDGRPGVWFFSLDCNQSLAVKIAKSRFHLPYYNAQMSATETEGGLDYLCRREGHLQKGRYLWDTPQTGEVAKPGSLEFFLLERYLLFSRKRDGELFCGRVHHEPYRFTEAKVTRAGTEPLDWENLPFKGGPISALASPGVDVSVFPLKSIKMAK